MSSTCAGARKVVGGGWETALNNGVTVLDSAPSSDGSSWLVRWRHSNNSQQALIVHALCVDAG